VTLIQGFHLFKTSLLASGMEAVDAVSVLSVGGIMTHTTLDKRNNNRKKVTV
jgi:hypothetical protein